MKTSRARLSPRSRRTAAKRRPPSRAREDGGTSRREAILTAALEEFSASGFFATRLDDVAARAGVAKGTIYLYFRDKESLFEELVRSLLTPLIGTIKTTLEIEGSIRDAADRLAEMFVEEVLNTRRKDLIRLMISEGPRFPKLAEMYYREILAPIFGALRALLARAAARGEVSEAVARFPHIAVAPGIVAVIWSGLFDRFESIDVRAMMRAHFEMVFSSGRVA